MRSCRSALWLVATVFMCLPAHAITKSLAEKQDLPNKSILGNDSPEGVHAPTFGAIRACVLPYILTIQEEVQTIDQQGSACCSAIEIQLAMLNANLNYATTSITDHIGGCCSLFDATLAPLAGAVANINSVTNNMSSTLDTCCSVVESQLQNIESVVDHAQCVGSCNLAPLSQALASNCSVIESQLDSVENSAVTTNQIITSVEENLATCCSGLDTQLSIIDADIQAITCGGTCSLQPLTQKMGTCCI